MRALEGRLADGRGKAGALGRLQMLGPQAQTCGGAGRRHGVRMAPHRHLAAEELDGDAVRPEPAQDPALDDLAVADEPGHLLGTRLGIQRHRVRGLQNPARLHHRHPVGHGHRLGLVVGDIDHGRAGALVELAEGVFHRGAQIDVEIGQRLVEQHHCRVHGEASGQRHTLALAAGQIGRTPRLETGQINGRQGLGDLAGPRRALQAPHPQRIADILGHAHMRPERIGLEDDADIAVLRRHVPAVAGHQSPVEADRTAGQRVEAGDQAKQGRLAAARRAEQRDELARPDLEGDVVDGRGLAEAFGDGGERDGGHARLMAGLRTAGE